MCTVKQTIMPTLSISMTAGKADNLMPSNVMAPKTCVKEAKTLNTTSTAAHTDNNKMETNTKAATKQQHKIKDSEDLKFMYCSQNINGMPEKTKLNVIFRLQMFYSKQNQIFTRRIIGQTSSFEAHTQVSNMSN